MALCHFVVEYIITLSLSTFIFQQSFLMHLLSVQNLSKHYGDKTLFNGASFTLSPLDRVGLVGVNGSGKTTLLRMIVGLEPPDSGTIECNPKARLAYLPQNPEIDDELTVLDYLFQGETPTVQLLRTYESAVLALVKNPNDPVFQERLANLSQRMDLEDGWAAEARVKAVLTRLGLTEFEAPLGTLSGGQRRRAAIARVLIDPADLLILDEPTNHLDPDTIVWLEDYLADFKTALLLVTHDRYFLDRVVTHILEIDQAQIHLHPGNYSLYLERQAARTALQQKSELDRRNILQRELAWLRRSPMARGSKQKARIQRIEALRAEGRTKPDDGLTINVAARRTGKQIMEIRGVSKSFDGQPVVRDFSYVIDRGARLGLIGPNGAGKSTLLNLIAGRLEPDAGKIITGATIHIGYYDQESLTLDESQRIIDYIAEVAEVIRTADGSRITAAQMLERFQFPRPMQQAYISTLSGGERRRLYLLRTLMMAPNFLLLDEPTNDLDIQTLSVLEDYLETFAGVLMVASHDRYFLDRTVEHIFAFEGNGRIEQYPGNYSAYQARKKAITSETEKVKKEKPARVDMPPQAEEARKLSYKERRELEQLEVKIMELEAEKETLAAQINASGGDYQRLQALSQTLAQLEADLDAAIERWAELSEIAEAV